jgi:hypothetical protein
MDQVRVHRITPRHLGNRCPLNTRLAANLALLVIRPKPLLSRTHKVPLSVHCRWWTLRSSQNPKAERVHQTLTVDIASEGKEHTAPHSFHLFLSKPLGARFAQQGNFIADLEECVPAFYRDVGSRLTAWKKSAPKIKDERLTANHVSAEAIADDAEGYDPD